MAIGGEGSRVNRTQEVAGSSPASSNASQRRLAPLLAYHGGNPVSPVGLLVVLTRLPRGTVGRLREASVSRGRACRPRQKTSYSLTPSEVPAGALRDMPHRRRPLDAARHC